jgi:hypothetical protein
MTEIESSPQDPGLPERSGLPEQSGLPERSDPPWAGVGVVVLVLVTGAFVTGWQLGRRWSRLVGW